MIAVRDEPIEHAQWNAAISRGMNGNGFVAGAASDGWESIAAQIAAMQYLGEDWDGLGAYPPSRELLESAL
jgi:hypothetical protein